MGLLALLSFNLFCFPSPILGPLCLLAYIICCGLWTGGLIFKEEPKMNQLLFGVIIVICWIIVSEGFWTIMKMLTPVFMFSSLLVLPLILALLHMKIGYDKTKIETESDQFIPKDSWRNGDFLLFGIFVTSFLSVVFTTLVVRTDAMIFSVWEVMPSYFWPLMFVNILSFVFLQKRLQYKRYGFELSLISSFLTSFLYFGLMLLVVTHSFDPDIWNLLSGVRVVFDFGGRDPTGSTLVISYSGYQAFLATFAKLGGDVFNLSLMRWITWLWSPIMASIYLPFITYQFLKKIYTFSHFFFLGVLGFMIFPVFWLLSVSVAEMVGVILLYVNLFFIVLFISDTKPYRGLFLIVLTLVATILVHPIPGTFAFTAFLLSLPFHPTLWKMKNLRYLVLTITIVSALLAFPLQFSWAHGFLFNAQSFSLQLPNLEAVNNFLFSQPIWLPLQYTADSICSENFNGVRYVLFAVGFFVLRSATNNKKGRIDLWLLTTTIIFWASWFIVTTGIPNLPYGTHRFARNLDIALIPFAAAILFNLSKTENISLVTNGKVILNKVIHFTPFPSRKRFTFIFSQRKILSLALLSLTILGMLSSFFIAYYIPSLTKNSSAELGRPIWRTVSADEMEIVQLINSSSENKNYCVLAQSFIPKLVAGVLGYRYYGNEPNLAIASGIVMDSTSAILSTPYPAIILKSMEATNSSVAFFVTEDWYVKSNSMFLSNLDKLKEFATDYQRLGSAYNFYFFKFDLDTILNVAYKYVHSVEEYDIISSKLIIDDEQPTYWETFGELSGKIGKPQLYIEENEKFSGKYSTKIQIDNGTFGRVGFYKNFDTPLDFSSENYLSFFLYGTGSPASITLYFMAPTPADSAKLIFTCDWEGWRFIKIPLEDMIIVRGTPDLSNVKHMSLQFTDVTPRTSILFDKLEVSR
jgi:hypothetical protein